MTRSKTAQERGVEFEEEVAADTGLEQVPRSGAGAYKLDVGAGSELRLSLKHTDAQSIRIDQEMLDELDAATSGAGGVGADKTGLMVVRIGGLDRVVAVIDWQDLVALLKSDAVSSIQSSKDEQRRRDVDLPTMLR